MLENFNELNKKKYQEIIFNRVETYDKLKEDTETLYIKHLFKWLKDSQHLKNKERKEYLINRNIERYDLESNNQKLEDDDGVQYKNPVEFSCLVLAHMYCDHPINDSIASNDLIREIAKDYAERKLGLKDPYKIESKIDNEFI